MRNLIKWLLLCTIIGLLTGSASALLLVALNWATDYRENHLWIIAFLPLVGLSIGLMYHYWGKEAAKGNNLLIDEVHNPNKEIPLRMAPLVFIGTILTHLFGGSAGREGTAVQMGGAIADQFSKLFKANDIDRKTIITLGISAGFASVFGTPLAGAVFALEVLLGGRFRYEAILPSFLVAFIAHFTCSNIWTVSHSHYSIPLVPDITLIHLLYVLLAGIIFGLSAMLFSRLTPFWAKLASRIKYAPLRPFVGGIVLVVMIYLAGTTKYIGLGLPTISGAFSEDMQTYDFILKILFTTFTIGVGFKGGEVTPLFFIGATLGNVLSLIIPLPMALLAGMGFVALFSGATNTPIACTLMGMELFGIQSGIYIALACFMAYLFSGSLGIYSSQIIGKPKRILYKSIKTRIFRSSQ